MGKGRAKEHRGTETGRGVDIYTETGRLRDQEKVAAWMDM